MLSRSLLGFTTLKIIEKILNTNSEIGKVILREYTYPAMPVGTGPAVGDSLSTLSARNISRNKKLEARIKNLCDNRNIGIESKVVVDSRVMHIPMMDFAVIKSESNLNKIVKLWKKLIIPEFGGGVIIETDNSYHFIGTKRLLSNSELEKYLAWSMLCVTGSPKKLKTYVDVQYVAYSLLKKSMCLRITAYPKSKFNPHVILEI